MRFVQHRRSGEMCTDCIVLTTRERGMAGVTGLFGKRSGNNWHC